MLLWRRKKCQKVGERQLKTGKQLYIGVQVRHEENSFYPWLFSNFIQISCDVGSMHRRLEFYNFYKDEQFDLPNHFLNYNYIQVQDLMQRWYICHKMGVMSKEICGNEIGSVLFGRKGRISL